MRCASRDAAPCFSQPKWAPIPFAEAFAQNASADDRAVLAAVQRPISLNCITVPVGRPLWKDVPSWFLLAEGDRMIVPETPSKPPLLGTSLMKPKSHLIPKIKALCKSWQDAGNACKCWVSN